MACGLPCVELASESMLASFGRDGALALAEPNPRALCGEIEALLDDDARREQARRGGLALMGERTWQRAAGQLEDGLRVALGR
jgi:O-antigen biosynthesis protein